MHKILHSATNNYFITCSKVDEHGVDKLEKVEETLMKKFKNFNTCSNL